MALTTNGLEKLASKLAKSLRSATFDARIRVYDSTLPDPTTEGTISDSTTGYVAGNVFGITATGNKVVMNTETEVTIPSGKYVKYYAIISNSSNASYKNYPYVLNTTVSDTNGTFYEFGGKFVLETFEFEVV